MPANVQRISQLASVVESTDGAKHVAEQHPAIRSSERLVGDAARLNQAVALKHLAVFVAEASFDDTGVSCTKGFVNAGNRARFDFEKNDQQARCVVAVQQLELRAKHAPRRPRNLLVANNCMLKVRAKKPPRVALRVCD